jgi:DNA-binding MarR family transcriptional regulator
LYVPAVPDPAPSLLLALFHAAHVRQERVEAAMAAAGLSVARFSLLDELERAGEPLPLREIAARQHCVRSNVTQLVDRLAEGGLVARVGDPDDRRSVRAALTEAGRERVAAGRAITAAAEADFEAGLSPEARVLLGQVLRDAGS